MINAIEQKRSNPYSREFVKTPFGSHGWQVGMIGSNKTVLEIGCGFGAVSRELTGRGCKVYGVEKDPEMGCVAAQYCEKVRCGNIEKIDEFDFDENRFDCILLGDVLEHLVNPELVLSRLGKYLAPSGKIVLSIPNIAHWSVRWDLLRGRFEYQKAGLLDKTHIRFFTFRSINQMIQACGYRVLSWNVTQGITVVDFDRNRVRPWFLRPISKLFQGEEKFERTLNYLTKRMPALLSFQFIFELEKRDHLFLRLGQNE